MSGTSWTTLVYIKINTYNKSKISNFYLFFLTERFFRVGEPIMKLQNY